MLIRQGKAKQKPGNYLQRRGCALNLTCLAKAASTGPPPPPKEADGGLPYPKSDKGIAVRVAGFEELAFLLLVWVWSSRYW